MLAPMYRDEGEAARLRIATLEAKLAERDAALEARDAELRELGAQIERLQPEGPAPRRLWPILAGAMALLVGANALVFSGMRPRAEGGAGRHASEPRTTTGVVACDEYLFRVELCLSRLEPGVRESLSSSLHATRDGWWAAGATAGGREKLAVTCEQALDALAQNPLCD
jgi:hypothetical protein